jgi:hypothetical protein
VTLPFTLKSIVMKKKGDMETQIFHHGTINIKLQKNPLRETKIL